MGNPFEEKAHSWWDPKGPFKTLHAINQLRFNFIDSYCYNVKDKKILDVGCGGGLITEYFASKQAQYIMGIDIEPALIKIAVDHSMEKSFSIDYKCTKVENLVDSFKEYFDIITCLEVLEHVDDVESLIFSCSNLLKPGGSIFFSTINRNLYSYLTVILLAEKIFNLLPNDTHNYSCFIRPSELDNIAMKYDLSLVGLKGFNYLPLLNKAIYSNKIKANYLACYKKVKNSYQN